MKKHTHKYRRSALGTKRWKIYKCVLPGCTYYIDAKLIENRISICWRCNDPFVIDKRLSELAKPHCHDCTDRKKKPDENVLRYLERMQNGSAN